MWALLRTLRPQQWVKNVLFVGAALVFSRHLGDAAYVARSALAIAAFCALAGAVYAFNDVRDVALDRAHPTKQHRPIAAGELAERTALVAAIALACGGLATTFWLAWPCGVCAALYLAQNVAYSMKLKQLAFVDVALIVSGFLLRVLAGAYAIDVPASGWLLACTALLAAFLGLGKRAHELAWAERTGAVEPTRASLAGYSIPVVRVVMLALAVVTSLAYVAYTVDGHTVAFFGTDRLVLSAPFVTLGLVRYLFLALWYPKDEPPTEAMLKDPWFLLDVVAAIAAVLYVIYG